MSCPSSRTWPQVGRSSSPISERSVDLPEPEGPSMATSSPASTVSETLCRAVTSAAPWAYVLPASTNSRSGVIGSSTGRD
jgi:hypothetical protein